jgi:hypothetical protein
MPHHSDCLAGFVTFTREGGSGLNLSIFSHRGHFGAMLAHLYSQSVAVFLETGLRWGERTRLSSQPAFTKSSGGVSLLDRRTSCRMRGTSLHGRGESAFLCLTPGNRRLTLGSHRLRLGSHRLRLGSQRLRPGSHRLRLGSHRLRPGSQRLRPGSHRARLGSHRLRPESLGVV